MDLIFNQFFIGGYRYLLPVDAAVFIGVLLVIFWTKYRWNKESQGLFIAVTLYFFFVFLCGILLWLHAPLSYSSRAPILTYLAGAETLLCISLLLVLPLYCRDCKKIKRREA